MKTASDQVAGKSQDTVIKYRAARGDGCNSGVYEAATTKLATGEKKLRKKKALVWRVPYYYEL